LHELVAVHFNAVQKTKMYGKHAPECIKMQHYKGRIPIGVHPSPDPTPSTL